MPENGDDKSLFENFSFEDNLIIDGAEIENVDGVDGLYRIIYSVPEDRDQGTWTDTWKNIKFTPMKVIQK